MVDERFKQSLNVCELHNVPDSALPVNNWISNKHMEKSRTLIDNPTEFFVNKNYHCTKLEIGHFRKRKLIDVSQCSENRGCCYSDAIAYDMMLLIKLLNWQNTES